MILNRVLHGHGYGHRRARTCMFSHGNGHELVQTTLSQPFIRAELYSVQINCKWNLFLLFLFVLMYRKSYVMKFPNFSDISIDMHLVKYLGEPTHDTYRIIISIYSISDKQKLVKNICFPLFLIIVTSQRQKEIDIFTLSTYNE